MSAIEGKSDRLGPSPDLHSKIINAAGLPSDCGMYYQDGRDGFHQTHFQRMHTFVEEETILNVKAWDAMIAEAPKDGPGMIRAIAAFCHPQAIVTNVPNSANALIMVGAILDGRQVTPAELAAGSDALADPGIAQEISALLNRLGE